MSADKVVSESVIESTVAQLSQHNIEAVVVETKDEALTMIKSLIPKGSSVMNGSSTTLIELGFVDYLKAGQHGWNNLHASILAETDHEKQSELRKQSALSDYYLGSVQALTESGEFIIASNTGSQLPNIVFTSKNLILVIGSQKIVPTLSDALKRLDEQVVPLENERSLKAYGAPTAVNKIVIFKGESPYTGRKIRLIIVKESLGFWQPKFS